MYNPADKGKNEGMRNKVQYEAKAENDGIQKQHA